MTITPWVLGVSAMLAFASPIQKPIQKAGETVAATATIQAIDSTSRVITIREEDGTEDSIYVPMAVKRFNELKVGDKIKARYYESYVFQIRKAGQTSNKEGVSQTRVTPGTGTSPSATVARQLTATVEVLAIDTTAPSIAVRTSDGRKVTRKIEDAKTLEGVKVGDRIDITYTEAAMVEVEPATPKK